MVGGGYTELLIKSAVRPHWMGYIQWVLRWVMGGRLGLIDRDVWVTRQAQKTQGVPSTAVSDVMRTDSPWSATLCLEFYV